NVSAEELTRRYRAVGGGPHHALRISLFGHTHKLDNHRHGETVVRAGQRGKRTYARGPKRSARAFITSSPGAGLAISFAAGHSAAWLSDRDCPLWNRNGMPRSERTRATGVTGSPFKTRSSTAASMASCAARCSAA